MRSSKRATVRATVALAFFAAVGCTTDRERVSDGLAARHYEAGVCARLCCVEGTGVYVEAAPGADGKIVPGHVIPCAPLIPSPAECPKFRRDVNAFLDEVELANDASKLGKLPKNARRRLKETQAAAEREGKP